MWNTISEFKTEKMSFEFLMFKKRKKIGIVLSLIYIWRRERKWKVIHPLYILLRKATRRYFYFFLSPSFAYCFLCPFSTPTYKDKDTLSVVGVWFSSQYQMECFRKTAKNLFKKTKPKSNLFSEDSKSIFSSKKDLQS